MCPLFRDYVIRTSADTSGGDGDDDDNKEEENQTYSMDDDFEDAANDFKGEQQERSFEGVRTPDGALPDRSDDDEKVRHWRRYRRDAPGVRKCESSSLL